MTDQAAPAATPQAPPRRGRKPGLAVPAILRAASDIVAQDGVDAFAMSRLAKALGVPVMTLYSYFPGREDLLLALAEDVYARFAVPAPQPSWQEDVTAWLWAAVHHFDANPEGLSLIQWHGQVSPGWLRRWLPLAALLQREGLAGPRLAFAMSWLTTMGLSFISAQLGSPGRRRQDMLAHAARLDPDERAMAGELWLDFAAIDRDEALAFGFRQIVEGLARLIDEARPTKS